MNEDDFSITPNEFVQEFKDLKDYLLDNYFAEESGISRLKILSDAGFSQEQIRLVKSVVDDSLTDALYTILMGLEGEASIHQHQITYKLQDEEGNELTGELASLAWEAFHEQNT